jgi:hypothetical protein
MLRTYKIKEHSRFFIQEPKLLLSGLHALQQKHWQKGDADSIAEQLYHVHAAPGVSTHNPGGSSLIDVWVHDAEEA